VLLMECDLLLQSMHIVLLELSLPELELEVVVGGCRFDPVDHICPVDFLLLH